MSYFDYLACSTELPVGCFGRPPKAVYPSYDAYRKSSDYVVPRDWVTGKPLDKEYVDEAKRIKGNVVVYATFRDNELRLPFMQ